MTQNCNCHGSGGPYSQTVAAVLERPRYSPGLILEDSDLTSAVDYTRSLSRLLFRNLFGCGVICGLNVKVDTVCGFKVTVAPGVALDGCGDPIQLPGPVAISLDDKDGNIAKGNGFWVILCGKEKLCEPRAMVCEADDYDGITQATRVRAVSEVSLIFADKDDKQNTKRPCGCGCPEPDPGQHSPPDDEAPVDCAEDCGCGTACDCGCCVLLAQVSFGPDATGKEGWTVKHKGVRRLIRPLLATGCATGAATTVQPTAPPEPPPPAPAPTDVYWGNDGGDTVDAVRALYPDTKPGDRLGQDQVKAIVEWIAKKNATGDAVTEKTETGTGSLRPTRKVAGPQTTDGADEAKPA